MDIFNNLTPSIYNINIIIDRVFLIFLIISVIKIRRKLDC